VEREEFISAISKYVEFWKQGIIINYNLCNEDESICGLLGECFVAFVKTLAYSKSTLLECFWPSNNYKLNYVKVELPSTKLIVDSKDPTICPLFWAQELETNSCIHPI